MHNDLIIDVGMHKAFDTEFYLKKGFRVVAIEANPELCAQSSERLGSYVDSGRLTILNIGMHSEEGEFDFYVNLEKDDWSSFLGWVGARNNTQHKVIKVRCTTFDKVLAEYGVPYYLKIDIERHDMHVLRPLLNWPEKPKYISVEAHEIGYAGCLWTMGYRKFKLVDQSRLTTVTCPNPPLEGNYVDAKFDGYTSGPFGEETPGDWRSLESVVHQYLTQIHTPEGKVLSGNSWFDFHAKLA
ncbi:MAG: FkbM family methyltransferase [Phycisphaerales bacterium]